MEPDKLAPLVFAGTVAGIGIYLGLLFLKPKVKEFERIQTFGDYVEWYLARRKKGDGPESVADLGDIGTLVRVFWNEKERGYVTKNDQLLDLTPLKTKPLNFHWSWGTGKTLVQGLQSHILEEGLRLDADAYFLSEGVSGHGNPMYALSYFASPKRWTYSCSREASSTPTSRATSSP